MPQENLHTSERRVPPCRSDAFPTLLNSLVVAEGVVTPNFQPGHFHYDVHVRNTVPAFFFLPFPRARIVLTVS